MDLNVKNANYELVMVAIEKYLKEKHDDACGCQRCIGDIAAYALNILPPHYYVDTDAGRDEEIGSPWVMVEHAVREAIEEVMAKQTIHPHEQGRMVQVEGRAGACAGGGKVCKKGGEKNKLQRHL